MRTAQSSPAAGPSFPKEHRRAATHHECPRGTGCPAVYCISKGSSWQVIPSGPTSSIAKGRQDAKRSNLWTKLVREIIVAARMGGGDPESNSRLRLALIKARGGNVPKDTISNAILKGTGQLEGVSYEEIRYEGYGIGGAALIIDCTTDNRVRTVADVRHALTKHGGNLGTEGSVSFMFKHIGEFVFAPGVTTEDAVMEIALEAGADDVVSDEDGSIEVTCEPAAFDAVSRPSKPPASSPSSPKSRTRPSTKSSSPAKMPKRCRS